MQGTTLLLLIITVLLNIYIAAYFTVAKKILRTLDVRQQEKREKNTRKWMWQARSLRPLTGTGHY